jgi:hypothetical protein
MLSNEVRTLLRGNASHVLATSYEDIQTPTYFQKVGLKAMLAADTVALSIVAFASGGELAGTHSTSWAD